MATYDEYMGQIAEARQDIGQRIANLPEFSSQLSEKVYGAEGALPSLRNQVSDQIRKLYDIDVRAADRYSNPGSEMFIRNPYQREKIMSQQHQGGLGQIQDLQGLISQRQDVLGNAMEKGLEIYKAGLEAAKFDYQSLLDQLDAQMKVDSAKRAAAGSGTTKGYPKFTEIVDQAWANVPTTVGQPGETLSKGGFNYTVNADGSWYPSDFGSAGELVGMYQLAKNNPYFDQQYGADRYPEFTGLQGADTSWQTTLQRKLDMAGVANQAIAELPNESADYIAGKVRDAYSDQFTSDEMNDIVAEIYSRKGEVNKQGVIQNIFGQ